MSSYTKQGVNQDGQKLCVLDELENKIQLGV